MPRHPSPSACSHPTNESPAKDSSRRLRDLPPDSGRTLVTLSREYSLPLALPGGVPCCTSTGTGGSRRFGGTGYGSHPFGSSAGSGIRAEENLGKEKALETTMFRSGSADAHRTRQGLDEGDLLLDVAQNHCPADRLTPMLSEGGPIWTASRLPAGGVQEIEGMRTSIPKAVTSPLPELTLYSGMLPVSQVSTNVTDGGFEKGEIA
jgi:hypothetical protein